MGCLGQRWCRLLGQVDSYQKMTEGCPCLDTASLSYAGHIGPWLFLGCTSAEVPLRSPVGNIRDISVAAPLPQLVPSVWNL